MKVLVVVSGNHDCVAPFVVEQAEALRQAGCEVGMFCVTGHGFLGYLHNLKSLNDAICRFNPDIVHAHYGLCGLLCTLQHRIPVVVTYHGSDINDRHILPFSRLAMHRAAHNIFVSKKLQQKATNTFSPLIFHFSPFTSSVLPCGIDTNIFHPMNREKACQTIGLDPTKHYILFAGAFDNEVKDPQLAKKTFDLFKAQSELKEQKENIQLLELKGYGRMEVAALMNAVDCLLMTSHSEGSPQAIKEALACGCPIVSVDVGDVKERLEGITVCHVAASREPKGLSTLLEKTIQNPKSRIQINTKDLDNRNIAAKLIGIYYRLSK